MQDVWRIVRNQSKMSPSFALSRIIITQKKTAQTIRLLCAKFKFQTVKCLEIMPYLYHWSMRCGADFVAECFISLNERVIITKSIKSRRSKTFRFWIRFYFETMSIIGTDTFRCFITRVWIMMRFRFHINQQPRRRECQWNNLTLNENTNTFITDLYEIGRMYLYWALDWVASSIHFPEQSQLEFFRWQKTLEVGTSWNNRIKCITTYFQWLWTKYGPNNVANQTKYDLIIATILLI